jgi:hypothetical protein
MTTPVTAQECPSDHEIDGPRRFGQRYRCTAVPGDQDIDHKLLNRRIIIAFDDIRSIDMVAAVNRRVVGSSVRRYEGAWSRFAQWATSFRNGCHPGPGGQQLRGLGATARCKRLQLVTPCCRIEWRCMFRRRARLVRAGRCS